MDSVRTVLGELNLSEKIAQVLLITATNRKIESTSIQHQAHAITSKQLTRHRATYSSVVHPTVVQTCAAALQSCMSSSSTSNPPCSRINIRIISPISCASILIGHCRRSRLLLGRARRPARRRGSDCPGPARPASLRHRGPGPARPVALPRDRVQPTRLTVKFRRASDGHGMIGPGRLSPAAETV